MSFPTSATSGQLYTTAYGAVYQYESAENKWVKYTMHLGVTGMSGPTGVQGPYGNTGAQGYTGLANFIDVSDYPATVPCELLWNRTDEALYAGLSGYGGHWIQISAGSVQGGTGVQGPTGAFGGPQGDTGLANFIDDDTYPAIVPVELLWNRTDEALYAGCTGYGGHWIQISAGSLQGATGAYGGPQGDTGVQGPQGETGVQSSNFNIVYCATNFATNSGSYTDVTELTYMIDANASYLIECYMCIDTLIGNYARLAFNGPSSPTVFYCNGASFGGTLQYGYANTYDSDIVLSSNGIMGSVKLNGYIKNGSTADYLTVRIKNDGGADNVTVQEGAFLRITKVA